MVDQIPNIYYNSPDFPKFSGLIMAPRHHAPRKSWPKLGFPRRRHRLRGLDLAQAATACHATGPAEQIFGIWIATSKEIEQ